MIKIDIKMSRALLCLLLIGSCYGSPHRTSSSSSTNHRRANDYFVTNVAQIPESSLVMEPEVERGNNGAYAASGVANDQTMDETTIGSDDDDDESHQWRASQLVKMTKHEHRNRYGDNSAEIGHVDDNFLAETSTINNGQLQSSASTASAILAPIVQAPITTAIDNHGHDSHMIHDNEIETIESNASNEIDDFDDDDDDGNDNNNNNDDDNKQGDVDYQRGLKFQGLKFERTQYEALVREDGRAVEMTPPLALIGDEVCDIKIVDNHLMSSHDLNSGIATTTTTTTTDKQQRAPFDVTWIDRVNGHAILEAKRELDCETQNTYDFRLIGVACNGRRSKPASVRITVADVNEFGPEFDINTGDGTGELVVHVPSTTPVGETLAQLPRAHDRDCSPPNNRICRYLVLQRPPNSNHHPHHHHHHQEQQQQQQQRQTTTGAQQTNFEPRANEHRANNNNNKNNNNEQPEITSQLFEADRGRLYLRQSLPLEPLELEQREFLLHVHAFDCAGRRSEWPINVTVIVTPTRNSWTGLTPISLLPSLYNVRRSDNVSSVSSMANHPIGDVLTSVPVYKFDGHSTALAVPIEYINEQLSIGNNKKNNNSSTISGNTHIVSNGIGGVTGGEGGGGGGASSSIRGQLEASELSTRFGAHHWVSFWMRHEPMQRIIINHTPRSASSSSSSSFAAPSIGPKGDGFVGGQIGGTNSFTGTSAIEHNDASRQQQPTAAAAAAAVANDSMSTGGGPNVEQEAKRWRRDSQSADDSSFIIDDLAKHYKEHILCASDDHKKGRHHYALFVRNCRLVFLIRRHQISSASPMLGQSSIYETSIKSTNGNNNNNNNNNNSNNNQYTKETKATKATKVTKETTTTTTTRTQSDDTSTRSTFKPAEWRWQTDQVCDNQWHNYELRVDYPNVELYIDGSRLVPVDDNPIIVDDLPVHVHNLDSINAPVLTVGACWNARTRQMSSHLRGRLASLMIGLPRVSVSSNNEQYSVKTPQQQQTQQPSVEHADSVTPDNNNNDVVDQSNNIDHNVPTLTGQTLSARECEISVHDEMPTTSVKRTTSSSSVSWNLTWPEITLVSTGHTMTPAQRISAAKLQSIDRTLMLVYGAHNNRSYLANDRRSERLVPHQSQSAVLNNFNTKFRLTCYDQDDTIFQDVIAQSIIIATNSNDPRRGHAIDRYVNSSSTSSTTRGTIINNEPSLFLKPTSSSVQDDSLEESLIPTLKDGLNKPNNLDDVSNQNNDQVELISSDQSSFHYTNLQPDHSSNIKVNSYSRLRSSPLHVDHSNDNLEITPQFDQFLTIGMPPSMNEAPATAGHVILALLIVCVGLIVLIMSIGIAKIRARNNQRQKNASGSSLSWDESFTITVNPLDNVAVGGGGAAAAAAQGDINDLPLDDNYALCTDNVTDVSHDELIASASSRPKYNLSTLIEDDNCEQNDTNEHVYQCRHHEARNICVRHSANVGAGNDTFVSAYCNLDNDGLDEYTDTEDQETDDSSFSEDDYTADDDYNANDNMSSHPHYYHHHHHHHGSHAHHHHVCTHQAVNNNSHIITKR